MKNDCVPFLKLGFLFRVHFRSSRLAPFLSSTDVLSQQKTVPCEWLLCLFKSVSAFVLRFKSMRQFFFSFIPHFSRNTSRLFILSFYSSTAFIFSFASAYFHTRKAPGNGVTEAVRVGFLSPWLWAGTFRPSNAVIRVCECIYLRVRRKTCRNGHFT